MVTIKKIAEEAGVSRGTVDRVINNRPGVKPETEERIREIASRLGYQPSVPGKMLAAKKKKIEIGFITFNTEAALFFKEINSAARIKAKELYSLGVSVHFFMAEKLDNSYLESFLGEIEKLPLDGVIISPLYVPAITVFLNRLEERNIPTIFYNLDNDNARRLCYVGCDYRKAGRVAAGLLGMSIDNKGKVAIATFLDKNSPSSYERMEGFRSEIKKNYADITVVNEEEHYLFRQNEYSDILDLIQKDPEIKAVYVVNPGDCNIYEKIYEISKRKDLKIITNDLLPRQKQLLKDGIITATIDQQPDVQGQMPLQIMYDYLVFNRKVEKKKIYTSLQVYIRQNLP